MTGRGPFIKQLANSALGDAIVTENDDLRLSRGIESFSLRFARWPSPGA